MQKTIGSVETAAGQKRRAGRILFGSSVQNYLSTLRSQYIKAKEISGKNTLNIHILPDWQEVPAPVLLLMFWRRLAVNIRMLILSCMR